jgi:hypothetical protein
MNDLISKQFLVLTLSLLFTGCQGDFDGKKAAAEYCQCMMENNAPKEYIKASDICHDKMLKKNRYYKLFHVDMADRDLDKKIPYATRDSVRIFILEYFDYSKRLCCKQIFNCDEKKRKHKYEY